MQEIDKWNQRDKTSDVYYVSVPQRHLEILIQRAAQLGAAPQQQPKWLRKNRIGQKPTLPKLPEPDDKRSDPVNELIRSG